MSKCTSRCPCQKHNDALLWALKALGSYPSVLLKMDHFARCPFPFTRNRPYLSAFLSCSCSITLPRFTSTLDHPHGYTDGQICVDLGLSPTCKPHQILRVWTAAKWYFIWSKFNIQMMFLSLTDLTDLPQFDVPPILLQDLLCNCLCQRPVLQSVIQISMTTTTPGEESALWLIGLHSQRDWESKFRDRTRERKHLESGLHCQHSLSTSESWGWYFDPSLLSIPQVFLFMAIIIPVEIEHTQKLAALLWRKDMTLVPDICFYRILVSYHVPEIWQQLIFIYMRSLLVILVILYWFKSCAQKEKNLIGERFFLSNMHYPPTLKIKHIIYYTFSVIKHFGRYNWWTLFLMFVGVLSRCYPAIKKYRSTNKVKGAKNRKSPDAARHLFMKQDCFCFFDTSVITAHKLHCCVWQAKIYPGKRV